MKDLVALSNANKEKTYSECAKLVLRMLAAVGNVPRRRDLSYISAVMHKGVEHDEYEDTTLHFRQMMSRQKQDEVKRTNTAAMNKEVADLVKTKAPELLPLAECKELLGNNEFRRVVYMYATCNEYLGEKFAEVHEYTALAPEALKEKTFSEEDLTAWGVYDKHTARGKQSEMGGYMTWLRTGITCAWEGDGTYRNVRMFGKKYLDLEMFYIELKREEMEAQNKDAAGVQKKKRQVQMPSAAGGASKKKQKLMTDFGNSIVATHTQPFFIYPHAMLLGWKNLTIAGIALPGFEKFAPGETIFIKTAEKEATIDCTIKGYEALARFGLASVRTEKIFCVPNTTQWQNKIDMAPEHHRSKLEQALARVEGKQTPHLITSWFDGHMLMRKELVPDSDPRLKLPVIGRELLWIMIINKWMGHGDLNEHNLMIGSGDDPHIMRVDMAHVEEARITGVGYKGPCMPMNERGFQVSQKWNRKILLDRVCDEVERDPAGVAAFVRRLKTEGRDVRATGVQSRWFDDDELLERLAQGDAEAVKAMQHDVRVYERKQPKDACGTPLV